MTNKELAWLFERIKNTGSTKAKQEILKANQCHDLLEVLKFLYDNMITTGLDMKKITKEIEGENTTLEDAPLIEVLAYIKEHNTGRDQDILALQYYINLHEEELTKSFLTHLFVKSVRVGIDTKAVNKAFPGLIYQHEVQQGYPIDKYPIKDGTYFYLSEKLNGLRCTMIRGVPITRQGKIIEGIQYISEDLRALDLSEWFVDGELRRDNIDGVSDNENFRMTTALVNSNAKVKPGLKFIVFDMFPIDQLRDGKCEWTYAKRKECMLALKERLLPSDRIDVVDFLYEGTNQNVIPLLLERMDFEDKEGMMLNLDVPYMCKRHRGCLKIKTFLSADLEVVGMEEGEGNFAGTLGALKVKYKNNIVGVGTGFTMEQRNEIWRRGNRMTGKIVEVKYKGESVDSKTGLVSLQFPVFVCERTDKEEESYN